jgi:hypothetical protein
MKLAGLAVRTPVASVTAAWLFKKTQNLEATHLMFQEKVDLIEITRISKHRFWSILMI